MPFRAAMPFWYGWRQHFISVTSSQAKGQTVIHSEQPLDEQKLRDAINATGYEVKGVKSAPYEKKGFFSFLKK